MHLERALYRPHKLGACRSARLARWRQASILVAHASRGASFRMNQGMTMRAQLDLFRATQALPEGFRYQAGVLSAREEAALVERLKELPFKEFEFHGFLGKRRVVSYGWSYDYGARQVRRAEAIPDFLLPARAAAARFAGLDAARFQQALVTEYTPGAAIGWHKDKPQFGEVIGLSLLSSCHLRFRRKSGRTSDPTWQR